MNIITSQERDDRYQAAGETVRKLYAAPESGTVLRGVFDKHNLDDATQYGPYVQTIGDVILGFYAVGDLPQLLKDALGLTTEQTLSITTSLASFLAPLNNVSLRPEHGEIKSEFIPIEATQTTIPASGVVTPSVSPVTQTETPEAFPEPVVPPVRTMEHDMDKIHGYGAFRKMYPDAETHQAGGATQVSTQSPPAPSPNEEGTVQATSQDEMLKRPPLAPTPSYNEPPQQ